VRRRTQRRLNPPAELVDLDPEVEPAPDATHPARPTLPHACIVFAGGALGVLARDLLLRAAPASPTAIPWMLVAINLVGTITLGLVVAHVLDPRPHIVTLRLLLATGILGGFTTYSSLVSAAIIAGHDGHAGVALAIILGTPVAGVLCAYVASTRRRVVPS
jgi:CrcB protein